MMPIVDIDQSPPPQPTATQGARRLRRVMAQTASGMEQGLQTVRRIVERHGRDALATELEDDGPGLLRLYNAMKAVLESEDVGKTVENLP